MKLSVHAPVLCIEKGLNPNMLKYQNDVNSGVVSIIVLALILLTFFILLGINIAMWIKISRKLDKLISIQKTSQARKYNGAQIVQRLYVCEYMLNLQYAHGL